MAKRILTSMTLGSGVKINNFSFEVVDALPSHVEGKVVYLSTDDKLYMSNGTSWVDLTVQNLSASDLLTLLKTVDGSGSGLDADTLDGHNTDYFVLASEKGANSGVATLDASGKIPASQLPNSVMDYLGTYNATTNTPTLANGTGSAGDVYLVSTAGTVDFGAGNVVLALGDWVVYNGSIWEKSTHSNSVASVNGQTGIVSLDTDDISEGSTNLYFTNERAQDAIGSALTDTNTIDLTYDDTNNQIKADVKYDTGTLDSGAGGLKVKDNVFASASHTHSAATPSTEGVGGSAGFISAVDKEKLDGITAGATKVEDSSTNGNIKINGSESTVYTLPAYSSLIGNGTDTNIVVTHSLNSRIIQAQVIAAGSPYDIIDVYIEATSANTVTIKFDVAPANNEFYVTVIKIG